MDTVVNVLVEVLDVLHEPLVGLLTVYAMAGLKVVQTWIGRLPGAVQSMIVPLVAWGLTYVSSFLALVLPTDLALWTDINVSAVMSAGIAMAIHAGRKAKTAKAIAGATVTDLRNP